MIGRQALPKLPSDDLISHQQTANIVNKISETVLYSSPILNDKVGQVQPPDNVRRDGMLAYADGTNWNPGGGKGYYRWDTSAWQKIEGVSTFLSLTDTPSSYTGQGGKYVAVKSDASGLEFVTGSSLWTDEGTYIRPNNVTNSGDTSFRIYDSGYTQIGANPAYTDSGGTLGGIQIQLKASGTTAKPNVWIERDITANYVSGTLYVTAGLQAQIKKTNGNAFIHGIFCEIDYSGGTNDAVAIGGRTISSVVRNLFGGWFRAESSVAAQCVGLEVNMSNSGDPGHSDTVPSNGVAGMIAKVTGTSSSQKATHGLYIATGDYGEKFHSGVTIAQNSIVPSSGSGIRQGLYIIGGSSSGNGYYGIRMKDYLEYGLEMSDATCFYNIAMHFNSAHILIWGAGSGGSLGGQLFMGSNGHLYWHNFLNSTTYQVTP